MKRLFVLVLCLLSSPVLATSFFSDTNGNTSANTVVIGTTNLTTGTSLDLGHTTNSMLLPTGTTGTRPTGVAGMVRYNSTTPGIEAFYNSTWNTLGGGSGVSSPINKINKVVFTSSGTYTPTTGMVYCDILMVGGGGGSGGVAATSSTQAASSGGGGGGETANGLFTATDIGASKAVTVGVGGTAGATGNNNGGTGGTTSVGSLISAVGGGGGFGSAAIAQNTIINSALGGAAGTGGTGGSWRVPGGYGGLGFCYNLSASAGTVSVPGNGGASLVSAPNAQGNGGPGTNYGAGGVGDGTGPNTGGFAGFAGASGIVIITEYISQ